MDRFTEDQQQWPQSGDRVIGPTSQQHESASLCLGQAAQHRYVQSVTRSGSADRSRATAAGPAVDMSTTVAPAGIAAAIPPGPSATAATAAGSASIRKTTSAPRTASAKDPTARTPVTARLNSSARLGVRFHTVRS
ncbi:hypothetical protein GCM10022225_77160 [Plantactinospora mayteni]|uniref:Uncharacterized protein n=1 Tax=Plantactinospora mayteni TaxID=566021 RepID=A0ABQ4F2M1_9ACTN|nr:hypothetical protein Pma05_77210 [Plantactinospora mayteni]